MNGPQIVLCSIADEELSSVIRDYGFELYRDFTEVPAKKVENIRIILGGGVTERENLKKLSNLSFVQLSSAGTNGYDDSSLYANPNVTLATASGVYGDPIAEYVIGGMLCMGKRSLANYLSSRGFLFNRSLAMDSRMDIELSKACVGIWGCGDIGKKIARKLRALDCRCVYGVSRTGRNPEDIFTESYKLENSEELFPYCDFIVSAMPETPDSVHYWNVNRFGQMKKGCIFFNVGRGSAVVFKDLQYALNHRGISGAVIDVSEPEPVPLWHPHRFTRRLLLTNQSSFYSNYNRDRLITLFISQFQKHMLGQELENKVILSK